MASGVACAEELLVRMIDPVSGRPITAGEFVPTAERFGLLATSTAGSSPGRSS